MNRDNLVGRVAVLGGIELIKQAAFHEAGHAAAIYFRNRYQNLPQIHFQISLRGVRQTLLMDKRHLAIGQTAWHAKLEGGLLLENPILDERHWASSQAVLPCQQACEADVVNLMAGPLAEAKHVAQRDGEFFNHHIVNYDALKNYGGKSDQEKIEEYLDSFRLSSDIKAAKLRELHSASFHFINQNQHWRAISRLANYIVESEKEIIACEEATAILEAAMETKYCFSRC